VHRVDHGELISIICTNVSVCRPVVQERGMPTVQKEIVLCQQLHRNCNRNQEGPWDNPHCVISARELL
jgi:hypothetical protein